MTISTHPLFPVVVRAIETDVQQLQEYGVDIAPVLDELNPLVAEGSLDRLLEFQLRVWQWPAPADYAYVEPSDPDAIRASWPPDERSARFRDDAALRDRLLGGWLGRAAGCCLGKPLEMQLDRRDVRQICEALGSWPLDDYLNPWPNTGLSFLPKPKRHGRDQNCTRGTIDHCPNDDDLNYPVTSLICLERYGADWRAEQLFGLIADLTPHGRLWSSGKSGARAAILGMPHPGGQLFGNPTRQSLGAMIRCDTWAYVCPGNVPQAVEFALRDAVFSQTRNGIYAGVFWTAALAEALNAEPPPAALARALRFVPPQSKFAEMVRECFSVHATDLAWDLAVERMYEAYSSPRVLAPRFHFNHSIVNSALVILAVLYGDGDFSETIGLAAAGGRDTDCTGATAGSLMGLADGAARIPDKWTTPLNDTYRSDLADCHTLRFTDLAARTLAVARELGNCS